MAIEKLPVKKMVEFRRLSEARRITFTNRLKAPKEVSSDGGNYWVRSICAIGTAFKTNDNGVIKERLDYLLNDFKLTERNQTKIMYQRNIDILEKYQDFDFSIWRPSANLKFLSKPKFKSIIEMKGLPIQINPSHVYSYGQKNNESVGGIWFITWLEGFKLGDLGIYSEALYRYLSHHYSKDFIINPAACIIVDAPKANAIGYNQILNGEIPSIIDKTLNSINKFV
jgi:hypothetical protein